MSQIQCDDFERSDVEFGPPMPLATPEGPMGPFFEEEPTVTEVRLLSVEEATEKIISQLLPLPPEQWRDPSKPSQWQTVIYAVDPDVMLPHGAIGHTRRDRLMSAFKVLSGNKIGQACLDKSPRQSAHESLVMIAGFLVDQSSEVAGKHIKRHEILPLEIFYEKFEAALRDQNDPLIQLIDQVEIAFEEIYHPLEMQQLKHDLLVSAKHLAVRRIYTAFVQQLNAWLKAGQNT